MKFDALFIRAVRGPVMLIVLGSMFALQQAGKLEFERTWPVLIIVFGIFKLIERTLGPVAAAPYPYGPSQAPYGAPPYTPPPAPAPAAPAPQPPKEIL